MNKLLLLIALVLSTATAYAATPTANEMCERIANSGYRSDATSCFQLIHGKRFDNASALKVCNYMSKSGYRASTMNCLETIANQNYEEVGQMQNCLVMAKRGYRGDAISCLQTAPRVSSDTRVDVELLELIRVDIENALNALEAKDYIQTENLLYKTLRKIE